jgi:hypothetical protein
MRAKYLELAVQPEREPPHQPPATFHPATFRPAAIPQSFQLAQFT